MLTLSAPTTNKITNYLSKNCIVLPNVKQVPASIPHQQFFGGRRLYSNWMFGTQKILYIYYKFSFVFKGYH